MNNPKVHGTDAYYAPDPENDILLQAIAACLQEDGHEAYVEGKGSAGAIIVQKTDPRPEMEGRPIETWTITTQDGHALIATNNIGILDTEEAELCQHIHRVELADPNCFQKIATFFKI